MADIARLVELIEPEAAALGFELVRVKMMPSEAGDGGEALQIMAEDPATGQLVIEQCAALSRRVSDVIDEREEAGEVLIEGAYHLEVSSPGIDRPLTRAKDFANWAGHEARIVMDKSFDGQRTYKGELGGIDGDMVQITDAKASAKPDSQRQARPHRRADRCNQTARHRRCRGHYRRTLRNH